MTTLEIIYTILLWIILGLFICHKQAWFKDKIYYYAGYTLSMSDMYCIGVIIAAPIIFIAAVVNLVFIKPWK